MNITFFINPATFLIELNDEIHMQLGTKFDLVLNPSKHSEFIEWNKNSRNEGIELKKLMVWFSLDEIITMLNQRVLVDESINLEDRYSRNECFFQITKKVDSKNLKEKEVLILGAGAVGTNLLWLFGTVGVKKITILDFDKVEKSNLNRQFFYDSQDVGKYKLDVLSEKFPKFNPDTTFETITKKIESPEEVEELVLHIKPDLLVLAIDTPHQVHEWVNKACVKYKIPYVSGGFMADKGIVGPTYVPNKTDCFECIDRGQIESARRLAGTGATFAPIVEYVSSSLFAEAIKILSGMYSNLSFGGNMFMYDWEQNTLTKLPVRHHTECPICHRKHLKTKEKNITVIGTLYYIACFILPVLNIKIGGNIVFLLSGLVLVNLLPLLETTDKKAYQIVFGGSIYYIAGTLLMTVLSNSMALNWSQGIAVQVYDLILMALTTVSLSSIVFLGIQIFLQGIKQSSIRTFQKRWGNV